MCDLLWLSSSRSIEMIFVMVLFSSNGNLKSSCRVMVFLSILVMLVVIVISLVWV